MTSKHPSGDNAGLIEEKAIRSLWKRADETAAGVGWTYDCAEIDAVREEAEKDCGYDATSEFTESVMKIADKALRAKIKKEG